ncbi:MAG: glycosyltransferase family 4 protein, partial [Bacteroidales bacterium]|nr:glycosyltransferase family 4 protein [Bacteroidales bacterium]
NSNTYILCVSENTRKDLLNFIKTDIDSKKTFVTYIASAQILKPIDNVSLLELTLKKYYKKHLNSKKYILSFCTLEPRKNIIFTIKCFIKFIIKHNINDLYFLLGGEKWHAFNNEFNKTVNKYNENLKSKIIALGYIDDKDINIFYSHALFFVYLSQYEGFGMPPLEAMQTGTPVIASNNSSLPEVIGEAGLLIPYNDENECIKAFETMYFNVTQREQCIKKGFEQANKFSWDITLDKISKIIISTQDGCVKH